MEVFNKYTFLPDATRGAVRGLTNSQLKATGTQSLVVNTLHLLISPGSERIKELGGIHEFMKWDGTILSDSGGFQVFSLLHLNKWKGEINENGAIFKSPRDGAIYNLTPERSIDIQMELGTDVLVVLDDCRKATTTREEAEVSVDRTLKWAKRCKNHFMNSYSDTQREGKILTAVVQGANHLDLRQKCAEALVEIGFDGYNFGGYLLDDEGNLVVEELKVVYQSTPMDKFNYGMGVGKPEDIFKCAQIGYKVFDTVLPTRNARHGTLYVADNPTGTIRLKNSKYAKDLGPIDSTCDCEACRNYSKAYIRQMIKVGEFTGYTLATIHNLRFYQRLMNFLNESDSWKESSYEEILNQI
jgi:queuine tRNA-ribosyltransferase